MIRVRESHRSQWIVIAIMIAMSHPSSSWADDPKSAATVPTNVRARVGVDYASRLLRSANPDERIRGIERAASIGTPQAVGLLARAAEKGSDSSAARSDPRALIALARALCLFADQESARTALFAIVTSAHAGSTRRPSTSRAGEALNDEEGDSVARVELARQTAAIGIARSGVDRALEQLYGIAKGAGTGQSAAIVALLASPPRAPGLLGKPGDPPVSLSVLRMLRELGDLRAIDVVRTATHASDVDVQAAALVSLAELGDHRAITLAQTSLTHADARLRAAAGEALVTLTAPQRFKAVVALIEDEATTSAGVHLAERVSSPDVTKALVARAASHPDRSIRVACIHALGRSTDPDAAKALAAIVANPELAYDAALALARSPAPNAGAQIASLARKPLPSGGALGVRAYVVRALVRGDRDRTTDRMLEEFARSNDGSVRALGIFARVAFEERSVEDALGDRDPRVRRAVAMGSLARWQRLSKSSVRALLLAANTETDLVTRQLFAVGLLNGDPDGIVTTRSLIDRVEGGGADMALAAYAFARRADASTERKVQALLAGKDPVLRAHAARGLGAATLPDASGRLAAAYAYETDVNVRRAIIAALAARTDDASSPARKATLETAARLDPDGPARSAAQRALEGSEQPFGMPLVTETAWLHITRSDGAPPRSAYAGAMVGGEGFAIPMAFDEEGFAIVPGLVPGQSRLILAPRLPPYEPAAR
ncbi:MAG: HEAT repeat domain-containing protein [Polyangiaceae bacterium]|nr:HEAT repeat domain-containing protein [Polyangiaceae bacterium]